MEVIYVINVDGATQCGVCSNPICFIVYFISVTAPLSIKDVISCATPCGCHSGRFSQSGKTRRRGRVRTYVISTLSFCRFEGRIEPVEFSMGGTREYAVDSILV